MTDTLTLTRPDDWHLHFRDGAMLEETVPATARVFRRAIVMPNLTPPVTSVALAEAYRERILAAFVKVAGGSSFRKLLVSQPKAARARADAWGGVMDQICGPRGNARGAKAR